MDWSAGEIAVNLTTTSTLNLTGDAPKILNGHQITHTGDAHWNGNGDFRMQNGAVFQNQAGASFDIQTAADLEVNVGTATFNNLGQFTKTLGGGQTVIGCVFNNYGLVSIFGGQLIFDRGGLQSGNFAGGPTTVLEFSGAGAVYDFQSGSVINASGDVEFSAGTVNFAGTYTVGGKTYISGGTLNFQVDNSINDLGLSDGIIEGDGNVTVSGTFDWTDGFIQGNGGFTVNGTFNISGYDYKDLKGRTLSNSATCTRSGTGRLRLHEGAVFHNKSGANFTIQNDQVLDLYIGGATFLNEGTVTKSSGGGSTSFEVSFNNRGSVQIQSGKIRLTTGSDSSATYDISSGATLQIYAGTTHRMDDVTISGSGDFDVFGGTLEASGKGVNINTSTAFILSATSSGIDGDGPLTVNGTFQWDAGQIAGSDTIFVNGDLTISGPIRRTITQCVLVNKGSATWSGDGSFRMQGGAEFINDAGGSFDIQNDELLDSYSGGGTFNNFGTVSKSAGSGTTTVEVPFHNSGNLIILSGEIRFTGNLENRVDGTIEGTGTLDVSGSQFTNDGTVSPGPSTGVFTVNSDYHHSSTASLNIELGGNAPGSEYDQLDISQAAILDGLLNNSLVGGFTPAEGDSFEIMHCGALSGWFQQIIGANVGGGIKLIPHYFPAVLILIAVDTVNHPPVAVNDSLFTDEDTDNLVNVLRNDYDVDGDSISIVGHSTSIYGTVIQISDSSLAYYPAPDFFGSDTFSYIISDGRGGRDTAKVYVTVSPVNDPPSLDSIPNVTFSEDDSAKLKLNQYVFDVNNDTINMKFTAEVISAMGFGLERAAQNKPGQTNFLLETGLKKRHHRKAGKTVYRFQIGTGDLQIAIDSLTLTVSDDSSATAQDSLIVLVLPPAGLETRFPGKIPQKFMLLPNYPNPFNPVTHIRFGVPKACRVKLEVFNLLGQRVAVVLDKHEQPGYYEVPFHAGQLANGMYIYRMQAGSFRMNRKMLMMK